MTLKIAVASSSLLALPTVEIVSKLKDVEIVGFISTPDRPKGRSGSLSPNPFAAHMEKSGSRVLKPSDDSGLISLLRGLDLDLDLVIVIAYGRLIKREALAIPTQGWINLHFSLLPAFRGAAPVQRALEQGSKDFGFSIFQLDEGMDSGPIYQQGVIQVSSEACATEILDELSRAGADTIPRVIEMIVRGEKPIPQEGPPSFAPKFNKDETRLDLSKKGLEALNQIRAFTRIPGVWTLINGRRVVITCARKSEQPLETSQMMMKSGLLILGLNGISLEIVSLIPEGRREMTGGEFARGLRLEDGVAIKVSLN